MVARHKQVLARRDIENVARHRSIILQNQTLAFSPKLHIQLGQPPPFLSDKLAFASNGTAAEKMGGRNCIDSLNSTVQGIAQKPEGGESRDTHNIDNNIIDTGNDDTNGMDTCDGGTDKQFGRQSCINEYVNKIIALLDADIGGEDRTMFDDITKRKDVNPPAPSCYESTQRHTRPFVCHSHSPSKDKRARTCRCQKG